MAAGAISTTTSRSTSRGWSKAISIAALPPMLCPSRAACSMPRARSGRPQVLDHFAIGHLVRPRRGAVIAQIEGQDPVARCEMLGDRPPIPAGAEQPMQDRNRRPWDRIRSRQGRAACLIPFRSIALVVSVAGLASRAAAEQKSASMSNCPVQRWGWRPGGSDAGFDVGAAAPDLGDHQACGRVIIATPKSSRGPSRARYTAILTRTAERRAKTARAGVVEAGDQARRSRRDARLEHLSPFRALLRDLGHRRGLPHDQPSAIR